MIIIDGTQATVLDVQIVGSDQNKLKTFNENKKRYYSRNSELRNRVMENYGLSEIDFIAITLHYKVFICCSSFKEALELHVLRKNDIKLTVNKVLLGGIICFNSFYRSTFK